MKWINLRNGKRHAVDVQLRAEAVVTRCGLFVYRYYQTSKRMPDCKNCLKYLEKK